MAYTKTTWVNGDINVPLNDINLNKIEDGIEVAHNDIAQNVTDISGINTTITLEEARIASLETSVSALDANVTVNGSDIMDIKKYNTWRTITSDPLGTISAGNVDNLFITWTGGAVSVALPATPTLSDRVRVVDAGADFSVNNLSVLGNGNNIMGGPDDYVFDSVNTSVELAWSNTMYGWVVVQII